MTILVTGATGTVGGAVVKQLVEAGLHVRAMTRRPGDADLSCEVVGGDLARPDSLDTALAGVERMFLFPVAETAREVVARAVAAGVRRIVVLSSGAVTGGFDVDFHLPVERAVEESGVEWTFVRPGEFAANKLWLWGPSIRAQRVVRDPNPDAAWYPTHERDIADVAVAVLRQDGHAGTAYTFGGPELLSLRQQVAAIAIALGEPIRFETVTPQRARELYLAQGGFAAENADMLLGYTDYGGAETDPGNLDERTAEYVPAEVLTAEQVTGRPARTFTQWAHDHAEDFR
ncbi:MAG: NAD(P)H-binding protein [Stackebrandtia sp.]